MQVFILGAGASKDFDLPLGEKLTDDIKNCLQEAPGGWHRTFFDYAAEKWGRNVVTRMHTMFHESALASIDLFLEKWRDEENFVGIGYRCIAYVISHSEIRGKLFREKPSGAKNQTWYRILHNKLIARFQTLQDYTNAPISFVTFNYDRSLELFLTKALSMTLQVASDTEDFKKIQSFIQSRIIHVHGSLGDLSDIQYMPVTKDQINLGVLDRMANGLRIVSAADDPGVLQSAREVIGEAKRIHVLGLSYQEANVKKVAARLERPGRTTRLSGTAFGLYEEEIQEALSLLHREFGCDRALCGPDVDCAAYIRREFVA